MTLADLAAAVLTVLLLCAGYVIRPHRARCPDTYDLRTGVRTSGSFECWPHPSAPVGWDRRLGRIEDWDGTHGRPERSIQSEATIGSRIYCTGGATPRQDGFRVWCQR